uniref:Palmitoyltransferase n=1 Tax=Lutzomyia longipalpis TaxID=7200 RepID=A0A7G3AM45_LUTLO
MLAVKMIFMLMFVLLVMLGNLSGIIKIISFVTLYMNAMWWPPNLTIGGLINQTLFLMLSSLTVFNFVMAAITGPGFVPLGWKPKDPKVQDQLQYCTVCQGYKVPRSHHCRRCDRCSMKMDHHCPWINNCVGYANHAYFCCFLGFAVIGCMHATILLGGSLYRGLNRHWYIMHGREHLATVHLTLWTLVWCVFSLGLAIGVVIAVGMLLGFQVRAVVRNRTGIEDWIVEKAKYRREGTEETFRFPYDLGVRRNIAQVASWSCEPIGDGIVWEIAEGCDQYSLTREQLAQKADKRARTRRYSIVRRATGSWVPLWSQGICVSVQPPCTDEPRIELNVGDVVNVTRWRKYWLFGEKANSTSKDGQENGKKSIRGWFPRRCAVELVESEDNIEMYINKKSK